MPEMLVKLGYDYCHKKHPIVIDLNKIAAHMALVGSSGSGKSMATLYTLYNVLKLKEKVELYIGDFKKSGDYFKLSDNFAEFDKVVDLIDKFYKLFENTPEDCNIIRILILDEYAGMVSWLEQEDKKRCESTKSKVSRLLMLSRSKHMFVWCIQQRMSASLFPSAAGSVDNFGVCIGFGRLSPDSKRALFANEHFENEEFEMKYKPGTGEGICLIAGQPLYALQIPRIPDKERLKRLLRKLAAEKNAL